MGLSTSRYVATCDVTVSTGLTLTILSGTEIRFNQSTGLNINGTILALGTDTQPITFTANANNPASG
ncbi:MAG: hypothetical protein Q7O66_22260, partial [Dehalococcoidia bacterium]|nr:hypothetical protein [Dehalococcoidia bacterium]